jgi:hypothetical protein
MNLSGKTADLSINIISITAFFVAGFLLIQLIRNQGATDSKIENKILGKVLSSKNETKNKTAGNFIWYPLKQDQAIHDGDSIFTGADATVTLSLLQGQLLKIAPETLIVIREAQTILELQPVFGHFQTHLSSNSKLHVRTGTQIIKLVSSAKGAFSFDQQSISSTPTVQAKGVVFSTDTASPDHNLSAEQTKQWVADAYTFAELSVTPTAIWTKATSELNFQWSGEGQAKLFTLKISKTPNFQNPIKSFIVTDSNQKTIPNDFEPGKYFWQLEAISAEEKFIGNSLTSQFIVQETIMPLIKKSISETRFDPKSVNLEWLRIDLATEYEVEVATDKEFLNIIAKTKTKDTQWKAPLLKEGNYFTRIGAVVNQKVFFSEAVPVTIKTQPIEIERGLATVNLAVSASTAILESAPSISPTPTLVAILASPMATPITEIIKSKSEVLPTPTATSAAIIPNTSNSTPVSIATSSTLSEAAATTTAMAGLQVSNIKNLHLDLHSEILKTGEIELKWNNSSDWKSFELKYKLCTSPKNCIPHQEVINSTQEPLLRFTIKPEGEGELSVELNVRENIGKKVKTEKKHLALWSSKPLDIPQLRTPEKNSKIVRTDNKKPLILKWTAVARASSYEVQISESDSFDKPLVFESDKNNYAWSIPKTIVKKIYWRVKAIKKEAHLQSAYSAQQAFSLEVQFDPSQSD